LVTEIKEIARMANQLYPKAKQAFLGALIDMDTDDIRACLTRTAYNASHEFLSSITDIVATSGQLASPTITDGVFDTSDIVYPSVASGAPVPFIVLFRHTGTPNTSRLIAHIDTATGLPVTPDGTNINVNVNAAGWFSL
jgi:hypothetical protein